MEVVVVVATHHRSHPPRRHATPPRPIFLRTIPTIRLPRPALDIIPHTMATTHTTMDAARATTATEVTLIVPTIHTLSRRRRCRYRRRRRCRRHHRRATMARVVLCCRPVPPRPLPRRCRLATDETTVIRVAATRT